LAGAWVAWLFLSLGPRQEEAQVALDEALQDSTRYSALIERTNLLLSRRDSIVQRVSIIQAIDQGRYVWPHILDEVARAVPDYTWVTQLQQIEGGRQPRVRIVGQAGNILALTVFMDQLEASPFLRAVRIIGSSLSQVESQLVYTFELEVSFEQPPRDFLETVPLIRSAPAATGPAMDD
jgi:Tfp pilus assembly protein PilN